MQTAFKDIQRMILEGLRNKGTFSLLSKSISPEFRDYPPSNVPAVYANNTGMGIWQTDRGYTGQVLFTFQDGNGIVYHKAGMFVSIPEAMKAEMGENFGLARQSFKHDDLAIAGPSLAVIEGKEGNLFFVMKPSDYNVVPAWETSIIEEATFGQSVRQLVDGAIKVTSGGSTQEKLVVNLWGDNEVYDTGITIPGKGNIRFKNADYASLEALGQFLITSPAFMRTYREMSEDVYRHRVQLLEETLGDFTRDDFDGFSDSLIDDGALKILQVLQPSNKTQIVVPNIQASQISVGGFKPLNLNK